MLISRASAIARWSIHMTTFQRRSPVGEIDTGASPSPSATREQVASKPIPATSRAGRPDFLTASRTHAHTAFQMFSEDCSKKSPCGR